MVRGVVRATPLNRRSKRSPRESAGTPSTTDTPARGRIRIPDYAKPKNKGIPKEEQLLENVWQYVESEEQLQDMKASCKLARQALDLAHSHLAANMTTHELNSVVHEFLVDNEAYPSPLRYYNFPRSCCISVNDEVCHGIPGRRILHEGDIVSIDVTCYFRGHHGDVCETYAVGNIDDKSRALIQATYAAMLHGIAAVEEGKPLNGVGKAIQTRAERDGFSVVEEYTGHGVGRVFHTAPLMKHFDDPEEKGKFRKNMTFTIEPMINAGVKTILDDHEDGWTVLTSDGCRSAQFEHSIYIDEDGLPEILTRRMPSSPPLDIELTEEIVNLQGMLLRVGEP